MLIASIFWLAFLGADLAEPYTWPLDLPRVVTSSFAEPRDGRFHAGIDLRTGDIGKTVHAPADGHVSRVRCSPWGYGKALYLQLKDGHSVVFGHLDGFTPEITDYVRKVQHERKDYSVDIQPGPEVFPVKQGDIVAWSGQTGTGDPHLHYEIRDAQGCLVNPRLLGITWPDSTPPEVHRILVVPEGPESRINGDILPVVLDAQPAGSGQYTANEIRAKGRIGFGIDLLDPANEGESKLGIHVLRTLADDAEIFKIQLDHFSYDNTGNETVSYYPYLRGNGRFLLQWRWPGNVCDIFQQTKEDGWYTVPDTPVGIRFEADDFFENRAVTTLSIVPDTEPPPADPKSKGTGKGSVDVRCVGLWLVVTAKFPGPEPVPPTLDIDGAVTGESGQFIRVGKSTFRAGLVPAADTRELNLRIHHERLDPFERSIQVFHRGDAERPVQFNDITVTVKSDSPYGTLFLHCDETDPPAPAPIPMRRTPFYLWPDDTPIDKAVTISIPIPETSEKPERLAIYRSTGNGWSLLATQRANGQLVASTTRFGTFAVLEDDIPPAISDIVTPASGDTSPRPTVQASVSDIGSGIVGFNVTCNGQWLLAAYDPERGLLTWEQDEDLPAPPRQFIFTLSDRAGNTMTLNTTK